MLEQLLLPELRAILAEEDWPDLAEICSVLHPSVVAEVLTKLEVGELRSIFEHIEVPARTEIFEFLPDEEQDELVAVLPQPELAKLLERMSHDDRADLVKRMEEEQQALVMPLVAKAEREDILRLVRYEEDTAGSIMTTDYAALPADVTVEEALSRLRREAPDRETIYYIYVIDNDRRLIGFVSLKDLILATPQKTVDQVMQKDVLMVSTQMDVEEVAGDLAQYDLIALPVVDRDKKLIGIVTHDDIIDVVIEEATEDAHLMGAVQPLDTEYFESPFWETIRKRVPWLAGLFFAEMLAVLILKTNGGILFEFEMLIFFMPVIIATGGNGGSQAATLITRALALDEVHLVDWWRIAKRELFSGLVLGGTVGLLGIGAVVILFQERLLYAIVLFISLILVTTSGSLIGSLMPLVFKRIGWDPAICSAPFVASVVDVIGILVYLSVAILVLH